MIDDLHNAEQKENLNQHREDGGKGVVFFAFEQLGLLLTDPVGVAVELCLHEVQLRLNPDHFDGIVLQPHRQGHQHHLGCQGKQDNRQTVVSEQFPAPFHDIAEGNAQIVHYITHNSPFVSFLRMPKGHAGVFAWRICTVHMYNPTYYNRFSPEKQ